MFRVSENKIQYTKRPDSSREYTERMDKVYTRYAEAYDWFYKVFPLWKKWLQSVLPYIKGKRLLEVSFGPAWLMTRYPEDMEIYGLDYNATMVERARQKLDKLNIKAVISRGNVEDMPYEDSYFDTVVNTMAFSGYPDGHKALSEMLRVLKKDGVLLILDYDFPPDRNIGGYALVKLMEKSGDIMKDIGKVLDESGVSYERKVIGGFKSIHLFIIHK